MEDRRYCKNCDKEVIFDKLTGKWVHSNNGFHQCYFDVATPKALRCNKLITFTGPYTFDKELTLSCRKELGHTGAHELNYGDDLIIWRTD